MCNKIVQNPLHYGLCLTVRPHILLSNSSKLITSRFFQHRFKILVIKKVFSTSEYPQTNLPVERYICSIIPTLRSYFDHPSKTWNLYTDILTFRYNILVHKIMNCTSFELVHSQQPKAFIKSLTLKMSLTRGTVCIVQRRGLVTL